MMFQFCDGSRHGSYYLSHEKSIDYLPPREFRRKFMDDPEFRKRFGVEEMEVTLDER